MNGASATAAIGAYQWDGSVPHRLTGAMRIDDDYVRVETVDSSGKRSYVPLQTLQRMILSDRYYPLDVVTRADQIDGVPARGLVRGSMETPDGFRYIVEFGNCREGLYAAWQLAAAPRGALLTTRLHAGDRHEIEGEEVVLTEVRVRPGESYATLYLKGRGGAGAEVSGTHGVLADI